MTFVHSNKNKFLMPMGQVVILDTAVDFLQKKAMNVWQCLVVYDTLFTYFKKNVFLKTV